MMELTGMDSSIFTTARRALLGASLATLTLWPGLCPAQGVSQIDLLASTCATCHGPDGRGSGKIPKLKGEDKDDLTESLSGFKSGSEKSTIMGRHAKALSDDEIQQLADYFAGLK
jgi:cytochrome c553